MAGQRTDRRVARTHALLQRAHKALILTKGYEATSVADICKQAKVGRSTFYAHFRSKGDLRRSGLENLRRELREHQEQWLSSKRGDAYANLSFSLKMFEHARQHLGLYRALGHGRGGSIALQTIRRMLVDLAYREMVGPDHATSLRGMERDFIVQYLVGAYMSVLIWWLDRGALEEPLQIDALFKRIAMQGVLRVSEFP